MRLSYGKPMSEIKRKLEEQFKEFFKSQLNLGDGNVALNLLSNLNPDKLPNLENLTGILDKSNIKDVKIGDIIDLLDTFLPKVEVEEFKSNFNYSILSKLIKECEGIMADAYLDEEIEIGQLSKLVSKLQEMGLTFGSSDEGNASDEIIEEASEKEEEFNYDDNTHLILNRVYGKYISERYREGFICESDINKLLSIPDGINININELLDSLGEEDPILGLTSETSENIENDKESKIPNLMGVYGTTNTSFTDYGNPNPCIDFSDKTEEPKLKTLAELNDCVIGWAEDRNIFEQGTTIDQARKTNEELDETRDALARLDELESSPHSDLHKDRIEELKLEVKDGIGDQLVTLYLKAKMAGFTLEECGNHSWNEIKDRKGKMVDGQFVKEV